MKLTLPDGRTLCGIPDPLHKALQRGVLTAGYACPDHLGHAHGPFLYDPTTRYGFVYHIRGDVYVAMSQILFAFDLLSKQHNPNKQHAN